MVIIKDEKEEIRIPIAEFAKQTKFLLSKLQEKTKGTFSIPEVEEFMKSFKCTTLKAKSSVKSDIRIVIHDQRTGTNPELGFSIKSKLGGASTLLNAGKTTNFIFKILPPFLSEQQIEKINKIENFWGLCKVRLAKFRGVHKHTFYLHIKECEFRYNCRNENLYVILLKELRNNPIKLS